MMSMSSSGKCGWVPQCLVRRIGCTIVWYLHFVLCLLILAIGFHNLYFVWRRHPRFLHGERKFVPCSSATIMWSTIWDICWYFEICTCFICVQFNTCSTHVGHMFECIGNGCRIELEFKDLERGEIDPIQKIWVWGVCGRSSEDNPFRLCTQQQTWTTILYCCSRVVKTTIDHNVV